MNILDALVKAASFGTLGSADVGKLLTEGPQGTIPENPDYLQELGNMTEQQKTELIAERVNVLRKQRLEAAKAPGATVPPHMFGTKELEMAVQQGAITPDDAVSAIAASEPPAPEIIETAPPAPNPVIQPRTMSPQEMRADALNKVFATDVTYADQGIKAKVQDNGVIEFSNSTARGEQSSLVPLQEKEKMTLGNISARLQDIENDKEPSSRATKLLAIQEEAAQLGIEIKNDVYAVIDKTLGITQLQTDIEKQEQMDKYRLDKYQNPVNPQIEQMRSTLSQRLQQREQLAERALATNTRYASLNTQLRTIESYVKRFEAKESFTTQKEFQQSLIKEAAVEQALSQTPAYAIRRARTLLDLPAEMSDGEVAMQLRNKNLDERTTATLYASNPELVIREAIGNANPDARKIAIVEEMSRAGFDEKQATDLMNEIETLSKNPTELSKQLLAFGEVEKSKEVKAKQTTLMAGTKDEKELAAADLLSKSLEAVRAKYNYNFQTNLRAWNIQNPELRTIVDTLGAEADITKTLRAFVGNAQGDERLGRIKAFEKIMVENGRSLQDSAIVALDIPTIVLSLPSRLANNQEVMNWDESLIGTLVGPRGRTAVSTAQALGGTE